MKIGIKKWFSKDPEVPSKIEVEVQVEEKTKAELFDEAVKEVVRRNIRKDLRDQLIDMCYSEEQVRQTKEAMKLKEWTCSSSDKFPLAVVRTCRTSYHKYPALEFHLDLFIDKLLEDFE